MWKCLYVFFILCISSQIGFVPKFTGARVHICRTKSPHLPQRILLPQFIGFTWKMKSSSSTNSGECTYNSYLKKFGSAEGMLRWKPKCGCGDMATLRRASTVTNYGRQFWGCRNYKVN